ncbi:MAG: response regulator [Candidatus Thermochlorobacter sp.]
MLRCQKEHRHKQNGTILQSPPTLSQPVAQRRRTDAGFVPPPNQVLPPIPDPLPQRRATDKVFSSFEEEFFAHQTPDESLKPLQVERVFESFEEEFFASFREEAISELKKFESFEEEFFARLNSRLAQLELPLRLPKQPNALELQPSEKHIFDKVFYGRSGKPRILVVDDEVRVLSALSELLSSDYDVLTCTSADAALDILENSAFVACILTDMRMPHKSGSDFLRESQSLAPIVPKILMTAFSDVEHITSLINQGLLFRHIEKPWDISKLSASLQEAVEVCRRNVERGLKIRCETVSRYSF